MSTDRPKSRTMLGVHDAILSLLKSEEKKQILDLGAGEGALSEKLLLRGHNVVSCDADPAQFKLPEITCQKIDLNKPLPFNNSEFDVAILSEVIEHLENPWHAIRESRRVLKPSGKLIISIPNILSLAARIHFLIHGEFLLFYLDKDKNNFPHITPLGYPMMERMLRTCGFRISRVLSNLNFLKETSEWERMNAKWYSGRKPKILSIINIIGMLIKFKVRLSKYLYKNEALLGDLFFYADGIIIEALKQ